MNTSRFTSVALAALIHFAPFVARTFQSLPSLVHSPAGILLKWVLGAVAVTGSMHTVSAGSATLISPKSVTGPVGTRLSYQIKINDGQNRLPGSWMIGGKTFSSSGSTTVGMPAGLSMSLNTGIISGTPTKAGAFPTTLTGYENGSQRGSKLTFTVTFNITGTAIAPTLTTSPVGGTVTEGGSYTFRVSATGDAPLTYQWSHGISAITGATGASLTLSPLRLSDAGTYTVTVRNNAGSAVSTPVTLVVNPAPVPPTITRQPAETTLHVGESLSLSVGAAGTAPLSYSWKRAGAAIPGAANSAELVVPVLTADLADTYSVDVSGPGGLVSSLAIRVSVVPVALLSPVLDNAGIHLVAETIAGRRYALESSASLDAGTWSLAQEFTGVGASTEVIQAPASGSAQFWRYRVLP